VFVLFALVGGAGVWWLMNLSPFAATERQDSVAASGGPGPLAVHVDFESQGFRDYLAGAIGPLDPTIPSLLGNFLPFEATLRATPQGGGRPVQINTAISMRLFAGLIDGFVRNVRTDNKTVTFERMGQIPEQPGLYEVVATVDSPDGAHAIRATAWPEPVDLGAGIALERGKLFELAMDNRDGAAAEAIAALLLAVQRSGTPEAALNEIELVKIIKGSKLVQVGRLSADFADMDTMVIHLGIETGNEVAAMLLMSSLWQLPVAIEENARAANLGYSGELVRDGGAIRGEFHLTGFKAAAETLIKGIQQWIANDDPAVRAAFYRGFLPEMPDPGPEMPPIPLALPPTPTAQP